MKYVFAGIALVAIFLLIVQGGPLFYPPIEIPSPGQTQEWRTIELRGQTIHIAVADTESTRQQGLGGRAGLAEDEGMLFVFPEDGEHAFWMKDMLFPIDILWISGSDRPSRDGSGDGRVVYMAENVSPDTYPQSFRPDVSARYVLELPAGYAGAHGVSVGDIVKF